MFIEFIKGNYKGHVFAVGSVVELDEATAWRWIRRNVAKRADGSITPVETKSGVVETASFNVTETAIGEANHARGRQRR